MTHPELVRAEFSITLRAQDASMPKLSTRRELRIALALSAGLAATCLGAAVFAASLIAH